MLTSQSLTHFTVTVTSVVFVVDTILLQISAAATRAGPTEDYDDNNRPLFHAVFLLSTGAAAAAGQQRTGGKKREMRLL